MKLSMENPNTGIIKTAPVGFSWTTLFFSGFPSLFRGDIKWFIIQVLLCWTGISFIIFAFIYNKIYINKLLEKGFKVKDVEGGTLEDAKKKMGINLPQFETKN
jgi:TM2 domain-containing membrane protein YozV